MLDFLDDILKLMSLGLEELTAFLDDIFRKMAEWMVKNKKVVSYVGELSDIIKAYTYTKVKYYSIQRTPLLWRGAGGEVK